jgi:rfaE bifunctional protein kinase chain/domain/rfaE bifunctional protein nucleotidyltransferase chain/domain
VRDLLDDVRRTAPVIVVVGDVILDRWSVGEAERVSREAPAPVIRVTETIDVPGGAANTAVNARALGARVRMVGLVGVDPAGLIARERLEHAGVDASGLVVLPGATTTTKTRVVGGDRIIVRVDEEAPAPDEDAERLLAAALDAALDGAAAVIVGDYGTSTPAAAIVPAIAARRPGTVVVDAHDLPRWRALRPDLTTPNHGEAERLLGRALGSGRDRAVAVDAAGPELLRTTGGTAIVVTLDRDGTVAIDGTADGEPRSSRTRATPASEQQASGAGDTFCAAVTVALTVGRPLADAAAFAQAAADVVVREPGTSICRAEALLESVSAPSETIVDHDELADAIEQAHEQGRRVVFTNGCFDVVHRGHTAYLRQARSLGDLLVVAVNDDDSVRRLKGPERPINTAEDRAGVLAALASVDLVTVFPTDTPIPLLERVRPDVYVKGGDYSPEMLAETEVVRRYGGEVVMVDYVPEHSTSEVVRRIRASATETSAEEPGA